MNDCTATTESESAGNPAEPHGPRVPRVSIERNLVTSIVFIEYSQGRPTEHVVVADISGSVMQAAVDNMVPGVEATCGGCCSCGTCHGYVADEWRSKLPPQSEDESALLESLDNARPESRLMCQIQMRKELNGMVVVVAPEAK